MKVFRFYASMMCILSVFAFVGTSCEEEDEKELQKFTVTFDSQGGSEVDSQTVAAGERLIEPTTPAKEGAAFTGWFKEAACTTAWNFNKDVVTENLTLYAGWKVADFTVTFETNGGSEVAPQGVLRGALVKEPVSPFKAGMMFAGWYTDAELTQLYDFNTPVTSDLTLYAKWTEEMDITREALEELVEEATSLLDYNYELWSYEAMVRKREKAANVLSNPQATDEEIVEAYKALSKALSQLVELPYRATTKVVVESISADGSILLIPGGYLYLSARGVDNNGQTSTNYEVTFDYNEIREWISGDVREEDDVLYFEMKKDVPVGSTAKLVVKSAEVPNITSTVTVKVVSHTDLVKQFKTKVNALPEYEEINMDNVEELRPIIDELIWMSQLCELGFRDQESTQEYFEFRVAKQKMGKCETAADNIVTFSYTFTGDDCKLYDAYYDELYYCTYQPEGSFPVGIYLVKGWEPWNSNDFVQSRIVLNADNTFRVEYRHSTNDDGSNAGDWVFDGDKGVYKFTGSQEQGGNIIMQYDYEDYSRSALSKSIKAKKAKSSLKYGK